MEKHLLKKTVTQSNFLIEAFYEQLTLREKRLLTIAMSMVVRRDNDFKARIYKLHISDYIKQVGIKSNSIYAEMEEITENLTRKGFLLREKKARGRINWFQKMIYFPETGFLEWQFTEDMEEFLMDLKSMFTKYFVEAVMKLKSFYHVRIYELIKQYEKIGERTIELKNLKMMLGLNEDSYPKYYDFKRYILIPAQKDMEEAKIDCRFTIEEIKIGRKVGKIKFIIHSQEIQEQLLEKTSTNPILFARLIDYFCLSPDEGTKALSENEEENLLGVLEYVEEQVKKGIMGLRPKVKDVRSYTLKAIQDGYKLHKQTSLFEIEENEQFEKKKKDTQKKWAQEELELKYDGFVKEFVQDYLLNLPEEKRNGMWEICEHKVKEENKDNEFVLNNEPILQRTIEREMNRYIKDNHVPEYEEWVKKVEHGGDVGAPT